MLGKFMKKSFLVLLSIMFCASVSIAAETHGDKETQADIKRHRAMAVAHEAAAKCFESGKTDAVCHKELQAACKGLAIGKFCGMKHEH